MDFGGVPLDVLQESEGGFTSQFHGEVGADGYFFFVFPGDRTSSANAGDVFESGGFFNALFYMPDPFDPGVVLT